MFKSVTVFISIILLGACASTSITLDQDLPFSVQRISAVVETEPMTGIGDRADDPAIWVSSTDNSQVIILGTNKEEGLHVYNLTGKELQFLDVGALNNVDLRENLAVATNDELHTQTWFEIYPASGQVVHLGDTPVNKNDPYGVCAGIFNDTYLSAVTYKDGTVQLWSFQKNETQTPATTLVRELKLASKLEGCVFDDYHQTLFIGEEAYGIWSLDLADQRSEPVSVDSIQAGNGLVEDTEGLSIWENTEGRGYLVASAQAADRFVVYTRQAPYTPLGIFTVTGNEDTSVDSVTHTDGLDVVSTPLPGFPNGLLVVQDDANPTSEKDQNFKLVDWGLVVTQLGLQMD